MDVARAAQSSAFRYYPNRRAIVDLSERMANARREICVLQTNVTTLLEYVHCFRTAQAARPELRIRVLTLDPVSKFVQSRGRLFSADDYKVFRDESKANLSSFRMRLGQSKVDCELRLYDEMPTFLMFKIDSAIVLCFITAVGLGRDHVHFEITDDAPGATETFMSHFEVLWERAAAAPG